MMDVRIKMAYFHNSCFTYTWLSDENRVIFRSAAQDTNNPAYLRVSANDRIDLALCSKHSQVHSILIQGVKALFSVLRVDSSISSRLVDSCLESCLGEPSFLDDWLYRRLLNKRE